VAAIRDKQLRYREGIGKYLQVLSAETPLLTQQGLDADLRSRRRVGRDQPDPGRWVAIRRERGCVASAN